MVLVLWPFFRMRVHFRAFIGQNPHVFVYHRQVIMKMMLKIMFYFCEILQYCSICFGHIVHIKPYFPPVKMSANAISGLSVPAILIDHSETLDFGYIWNNAMHGWMSLIPHCCCSSAALFFMLAVILSILLVSFSLVVFADNAGAYGIGCHTRPPCRFSVN